MTKGKFLRILIIMFMMLNGSVLLAKEDSDKKGSDSEISDVVIKGEAKDKIEIEKASPKVDVKIEELLDSSTEKTEELLQNDIVVPGKSDFAQFNQLNSYQVVRPYLPDILTPPLVSFYPHLSQGKIKGWRLVVTNEEGAIIKAIKGKGLPTKVILWDGKNEKDEMIKVNALYSFKFVTIDLDSREHTTLGKSFQVDALMYEEKGKIRIEIANKVLYASKKAIFLKKGKQLIDKTVDILRQYSRHHFSVEMLYQGGKDEYELAHERMQELVDYITDEMTIVLKDMKFKVKKEEENEITVFTIHLK